MSNSICLSCSNVHTYFTFVYSCTAYLISTIFIRFAHLGQPSPHRHEALFLSAHSEPSGLLVKVSRILQFLARVKNSSISERVKSLSNLEVDEVSHLYPLCVVLSRVGSQMSIKVHVYNTFLICCLF